MICVMSDDPPAMSRSPLRSLCDDLPQRREPSADGPVDLVVADAHDEAALERRIDIEGRAKAFSAVAFEARDDVAPFRFVDRYRCGYDGFLDPGRLIQNFVRRWRHRRHCGDSF